MEYGNSWCIYNFLYLYIFIMNWTKLMIICVIGVLVLLAGVLLNSKIIFIIGSVIMVVILTILIGIVINIIGKYIMKLWRQ